MKNNRNTLLLVAGAMQIARAVVNMAVLIVLAVKIDALDSWLRLTIDRSNVVAYNASLVTMLIVGLFVYLGLTTIIGFASGGLYLAQSKLGTQPLTARGLVACGSAVNMVLCNSIVASALVIAGLIVDKNQPDAFNTEKEYSVHLKQKIDQVKKLKEDGTISKQEFLDMLTKLLVDND